VNGARRVHRVERQPLGARPFVKRHAGGLGQATATHWFVAIAIIRRGAVIGKSNDLLPIVERFGVD